MSSRDDIKIENATITGKEPEEDDVLADTKKTKKARNPKAAPKKEKKAKRQAVKVQTPLTPEETSIKTTGDTKKASKNRVVLDPSVLRGQERKDSYAEGEINPSAPPAGGKAFIDIRKMDRKDSYAEGEVNPSAPPSPV